MHLYPELIIQNKEGNDSHTTREANKCTKYIIKHETREAYSPKAEDANLLGMPLRFEVLGL